MARGSSFYRSLLGYALGFLARHAALCGGLVPDINVALHAQVPPSAGFVVGSAVTMAGVRQALLDRERSASGGVGGGRASIFPAVKIAHTQIFYPFNYIGLHERQWDLVIIEGWFLMINAFIHEVRAISHPRRVKIIFYCLDPNFPGLSHLSSLDVDGFFTNSDSTRDILSLSAPTALVPLAVDPEAFPFYLNSPSRTETTNTARSADGGDAVAEDRKGNGASRGGRIVFVGTAKAMDYKSMLDWMLREAMPYGLDIYGSGWQDLPEFSLFWRGVLPEEELASVYGMALAVIGVTMDAQREMGMVNNRVFEALSVGAALISDHFPALEALCGDKVLYVRSPGDVARHIEDLRGVTGGAGEGRFDNEEALAKRRGRRAFIEEGQTWPFRVEEMLSFAASLDVLPPVHEESNDSVERDKGERTATIAPERCSAAANNSCLRLAIVVDPDLVDDFALGSTFVPAVDLLKSVYRIDWWQAPERSENRAETEDPSREHVRQINDQMGGGFEKWRVPPTSRDESYLGGYDIVWAVGRWGGAADSAVRHELATQSGEHRGRTPSLSVQLRGMVLWGGACIPQAESGEGTIESEKRNVQTCPGFGGREGLRWYDVVYCQTSWDHALLHERAFEGEVSDNLQVAWGFGPIASVYAESQPTAISELSDVNQPLQGYDILLVGTDDQIPEMLTLLDRPGLMRIALVVLLPPDGLVLAARPALLSLLDAAGVSSDIDTTTTFHPSDLPSTLSLTIADNGARVGGGFAPKQAEIVLIRRANDAVTLAKTAFVAEEIAILAREEIGAWATLVVATARGNRGQEKVHFVNHEDGGRVQSLRDQWPHGRHAEFYSRCLVAGTTRALCLGRGNSRISMVRPTEGSSTVVGNGDVFTMEVDIEEFETGRDGTWCVTADGRTLLCILLDQRTIAIEITSFAAAYRNEWDTILESADLGGVELGEDSRTGAAGVSRAFISIDLRVELRSNIYMDVLHHSGPTTLLVDPTGAKQYVGCSTNIHDQPSYDEESVPEGYCAYLNVTDFLRPEAIVFLALSETEIQSCTSGDGNNSRPNGGAGDSCTSEIDPAYVL